MYLQHFGLTQAPLGKGSAALWWDDDQFTRLAERFKWLLDSPGIGLLTGEAGVGKTAMLRQLTRDLNPHQYRVVYLPETDFGRVDIYRGLALALGLEPAFRRAQLWRDIKARVHELVDSQQQLPVWIIDEAQNLPPSFFKDFPAFLNFAFDSRDLMTVWLVGLTPLAHLLSRAPYAALSSRVQVRLQLQAVPEKEPYQAMVEHAFNAAGCQQRLLSDSGLDLLRQASQGNPRYTGMILQASLYRAMKRQLNHLPDDVIVEAIEELRS